MNNVSFYIGHIKNYEKKILLDFKRKKKFFFLDFIFQRVPPYDFFFSKKKISKIFQITCFR
jgi:hypothetical protein